MRRPGLNWQRWLWSHLILQSRPLHCRVPGDLLSERMPDKVVIELCLCSSCAEQRHAESCNPDTLTPNLTMDLANVFVLDAKLDNLCLQMW